MLNAVLELGRACQVELALDAHDQTLLAPVQANCEVHHIPHELRV